MIKWLVNDEVGSSLPAKWLCLTSPEQLLRLADQYKSETSGLEPELTDTFTKMVSEIWVNGTQKLTSAHRLPETMHCCCRHLAHESGQRITFLDIGASDGITTYEAVRMLQKSFRSEIQAVAMDRYTTLVRYDWGPLCEYRTTDGSPVLLRLGPFAIRLARPLGLCVSEWLRRRYLGQASFRRCMRRAVEISLVHPHVRAEALIEVIEANAMERQGALVNAIDVARASNILNWSYLSADEIRRVVEHVHAYLREGGLFVVSRNVKTQQSVVERGSLWRKCESQFELIDIFGGGSDIDQLVCEFRSNTDDGEDSSRLAA